VPEAALDAAKGVSKDGRIRTRTQSPDLQQAVSEVIPFYGARDLDLFGIERRCMDRDGLLIHYLE
tara:strand:+ start:569 stop:763 length:195 start_codon:yes stop_codon:yes gene_type:complete